MFEPVGVLEILHESTRISGGNVLLLPENGEWSEGGWSEPVTDYFVGVIAPAGVMGLFFVIWLILLCVAGSFRKCSCCSNTIANVLFFILMTISCIGWFLSIDGNVRANTGAGDLIDYVDQVRNYGEDSLDKVDNINTFLEDIDKSVGTAKTDCQVILDFANVTFPDTSLGTIPDMIKTLVSDKRTELDDALSGIEEMADKAAPYVSRWKAGYLVIIILIIVLVGVFTLSTVYRVLKFAPGKDTGFASFISKISGAIFFSVGILLLMGVWSLVGLFSIGSTIGADACIPDPDKNVNRLIESQVKSQPTYNSTLDFCQQENYSYLCYYQTCEGENPFAEAIAFSQVLSMQFKAALTDVTKQVNDTLQTLEEQNVEIPPEASKCESSLEILNKDIAKVDGIFNDVTGIVECDNINPIYTGIVYDSLCNGVIAGMGIMYISMCLGASALMAGMIIYRVFNFENYRYGEIKNSQSNNGKPITTTTGISMTGMEPAAK